MIAEIFARLRAQPDIDAPGRHTETSSANLADGTYRQISLELNHSPRNRIYVAMLTIRLVPPVNGGHPRDLWTDATGASVAECLDPLEAHALE